MNKRTIGRSALKVSPICLGGNVFGWTIDEAQSFAVLDAFMDRGFEFIDTADVYSTWAPGNTGGESERIIGNWMAARGNRDKVVVATKVGSDMGGGRKGLKRDYILAAVEDSLKRLRTDYIDLYQSHRDDPDTPVEEMLEAYRLLVEQGKVRVIGASNFTPARLEAAVKAAEGGRLPRYECLQPEYNLYARADYERDLEPLVLRDGIGVIPYFSLASGFLTGKYRSEADAGKSARGKGIVAKYLNERGFRILAALDAVAKARAATPSAVALAWLIARPSITAPIASATSPAQVAELWAAAQLSLSPEDIASLDAASKP